MPDQTAAKPKTLVERRQELEQRLADLKLEQELAVLERKIERLQRNPSGHLPEPIQNMAEYLIRLQDDMEQIRSGELTDRQGALILKGHQLIQKVAELSLQHQRLHKGKLVVAGDIRLISASSISTEVEAPRPNGGDATK